jgi:hypothetical protein
VTVSEKNDTGCVKNFGRTSAAGAFVSGILALALEAKYVHIYVLTVQSHIY